VRRRNQIRSIRGLGGPEDGVTISVAWRDKTLDPTIALETNFAESGRDIAGAEAKRASAKWFPLQHFCPELGASGVAGAES
jgi:hypothetical protein